MVRRKCFSGANCSFKFPYGLGLGRGKGWLENRGKSEHTRTDVHAYRVCTFKRSASSRRFKVSEHVTISMTGCCT
ncbi:hypothetical protein TcasGA2_TC032941 [Tribolium castaneum]|uniref:Uncharacterized protein n=1 Tax=Tribolium castaneum TaxID=7070 RepID=A0A139WJZ8_TRICA|nr:hypothetical protein TcasGA2_TC032941 [Tribolium castaneum]